MSEKRIGKGKPGPGRPKGRQNKGTVAAKEAFHIAFNELGGAMALATWAKRHKTEFYKLFARLIPTETHLSDPNGGPAKIRVEFVGGNGPIS